MSKAAAPVRLDKLLANLGYGSRREVQALVRAGRVVLDGVPVTTADERVALSPQLPQRLSIAGVPCDPPPGLVLAMHKPLGMTCSKPPSSVTIPSPRWRLRDPPLSSIGRLDKDTSGLLLLTDDGDLLHKIISPKARISKRYRATLARPLRGDEGALFASGTLTLDGETKPLAPAKLEILSPQNAELTITEGRYHQVRRMFAATGNHVLSLHRDRIGALMLDPALDAGAMAILDANAVKLVFNDES